MIKNCEKNVIINQQKQHYKKNKQKKHSFTLKMTNKTQYNSHFK